MKSLLLAFMVLILGSFAIFVVSCGEKEDADDMKMDDGKTDSKADADMKHDGMNHDEMGDDMMKNDEMKKDDKDMIIVSTCPVMDAKAKLDGKYIDYQGYRVYFCCDGCDDTFAKDPEKYIAKIKANPEKYIKQ